MPRKVRLTVREKQIVSSSDYTVDARRYLINFNRRMKISKDVAEQPQSDHYVNGMSENNELWADIYDDSKIEYSGHPKVRPKIGASHQVSKLPSVKVKE